MEASSSGSSTTPSAKASTSQEDESILEEEIKAEELEDATASGDTKSQAKRLLMKDWLVRLMDSNEIPDVLRWVNKREGLFRIKWLHKATDSWEVQADGVLFKEWCKHTGRFDPNNENPRKWKANFRCALNSLSDIVLIPQLCVRKGKDAYRVFKILPEKNPEKVKEKQESSRKRRIMQKHLKEQKSSPAKKVNLSRGESSTKKDKSSQSAEDKTSGNGGSKSSVPFNGMDALITAAALMAEKPTDGDKADNVPTSASVSVNTTGDKTTIPKTSLLSEKCGESVVSASRTPFTVPVSTVPHCPAGLTMPPGTLPLFRSPSGLTPVRYNSAGTAPAGNILLNLRVANPPTNSTKVLQPAQCLTIPQLGQLQNLPGQGVQQNVCLQQVMTSQGLQAVPAYIIPKSMMHKTPGIISGSPMATSKLPTTVVFSTESDKQKRIVTNATITTHDKQILKEKPFLKPMDYTQLKASIDELDLDRLKFQMCKFTDRIQAIRLYSCHKASVELAICVKEDFSYAVHAHNKKIISDHSVFNGLPTTISSAADMADLLQRLSQYTVCIGNPDNSCHQQYSDYKDFCSAYREADMGATNRLLEYSSTIRSMSCDLLVKSPDEISEIPRKELTDKYRCSQCSKVREQVLSMKGLFTLLDLPKHENTETVRSKRVKTLKENCTKDELAAKVDDLDHKLTLAKKLIPLGLPGHLPSTQPATNPAITEITKIPTIVVQTKSLSMKEAVSLLSSNAGETIKPGDDNFSAVEVGKLITLDGSGETSGDTSADIHLDSVDMPSTEKLLEELSNSNLANS